MEFAKGVGKKDLLHIVKLDVTKDDSVNQAKVSIIFVLSKIYILGILLGINVEHTENVI